ncbi:MAG: GNAT family N-acetyltransferase [Spirochaetales bacterium]|nr:GNAT family N-acetyltransferase [Spirochaetales bacterium]MCF7938948.1 GNAT family N-acetyltransferase [Spirochaetales bacterium]
MSGKEFLSCESIRHGSPEYEETVALRDAVLRRPLGLEFDTAELAAEDDSYHLVCRRGGVLAACVVLTPLGGEGTGDSEAGAGLHGAIRLRQMAVREELRGQGIGRELVRFAEKVAAGQGCREIVLHAREHAAGFYEKLGYRKEGERFFEVGIPHFFMRKELPVSE